MEQTEIAWAAGFFDGEGCFSCSKGRVEGVQRFVLRASINQVDPEVLYRFLQVVTVGTVKGPYGRDQGRPQWKWQTQSLAGVQHVFDVLYPYLGTVKRIQGAKALRLYAARPLLRSIRE